MRNAEALVVKVEPPILSNTIATTKSHKPFIFIIFKRPMHFNFLSWILETFLGEKFMRAPESPDLVTFSEIFG
jgi:hypothetical protein